MNARRKGTRNEHRSRLLLEAAGLRRHAHRGVARCLDLIGVDSTNVVLVQVKTRDWPGSAEMEMLNAFRVPVNCRQLVHRWRVLDVREL